VDPENPENPKRKRLYEEIFKKNLSEHSINAFKALYYGVPERFEAVPVNASTATRLGNIATVSEMVR
jgi:hypothetical protein